MGKNLAIYGSKGYTMVEYECTDNWQELLLGVNIGGAGTIIASLARLYGSMPDTDPVACNGTGCG